MKSKIPLPKPHHIPPILIGLAAIVFSTGLVLTLLQKDAHVVNGNIYMAPVNTVAQAGGEMSVTVRISPGISIDTVTASLSYDTGALTYKKADYTGSPFSSQIPATVKDNTITVQSAKLGGQTVTDDSLVATLLFVTKNDNASVPKLVYGNAAHAGIATNPSVAGLAVSEAANPLAVSTQTANVTSGATKTISSTDAAANAALSPLAKLLNNAGVSEPIAKGIAPWLFTTIILCIAAAIVALGWFIYEQQNKKHHQEGAL